MTATKRILYTGKRRMLLTAAQNLLGLGWNPGLARADKSLNCGFAEAAWPQHDPDWDAISIIIDQNLVVVDFDRLDMQLPGFRQLPPTLKERTRKGWHLYYDLPDGDYDTRIKPFPGVDLLTHGGPNNDDDDGYFGEYGECAKDDWVSHVLCAPSDGYELVYPDLWCPRNEIAPAPDWLIDEVSV